MNGTTYLNTDIESIFLRGKGVPVHADNNKVVKANATGSDDMACGPGAGDAAASSPPVPLRPSDNVFVGWGPGWNFSMYGTPYLFLGQSSSSFTHSEGY